MLHIEWYLRANLKARHLQLLIALDEYRHIGRVAEVMHVSQPAISRMLSGVEEAMNLPLFDRTSRGLEPTDYGVCLIKYARAILREYVNARDELMDIIEGTTGRVAIGVLPASTSVLIPRFVKELGKTTTNTTITIQEGTTDLLLDKLQLGDSDLLVVNLSGKNFNEDYEVKVLCKDKLTLVAKKGHPLIEKKELTWEDIGEYPMILPPRSTGTRALLDEFFLRKGISLSRRCVESVSTLTNLGILLETDSTAFLAEEVAIQFQRLGVVSLLPLQPENVDLKIGLVWMKDRRRSSAQELVIEMFGKVMTRLEEK